MADTNQESEHNVRVMARFRPETRKESKSNTHRLFDVRYSEDERGVQVHQETPGRSSTDRDFIFDKIFGPRATQEYVFQSLARSVVDDVVQGFNGTIFAYGQTGSGKTHSMFGPSDNYDQRGVIPRSAEYLFDELQKNDDIKQVTIKCSFLEIYKERIRDLLNPTSDERMSLKLRETPRGDVRILGLMEEYVSSPKDILELISQGESQRSTSKTEMNERSSRSHSVLTVTVTQKLQDASIRVGKLHMADLAGSERVHKSGLSGQTLQEAKKINQSLSSLGNCINALTDRTRSHIPFRDSRLTYLLKDSLGGNTKTSLLITCSPHPNNSEETLSALMFGQRASHIKNTVRINRQLSVTELQSLVGRLRKQLADSRATIRQLMGGSGGGPNFLDDVVSQNNSSQARNRTLPSRPHEAAELYAAFGDLAMGDEQQIMAMKNRPINRKTLPAKSSDMYSTEAALDYALTEELVAQYGEMAEYGFLDDVDDPHMAQSSLALSQKSAVRQKVKDGSLEANIGYADDDMLGQKNRAVEVDAQGSVGHGARENVVQRAKEAIRRSLVTEADSDNDDESKERMQAKLRLQNELAAAKKRREDIREAQRKRADQWAAKKGDEDHTQLDSDGKNAKWRKRRDSGLAIVTDGDPTVGDAADAELWSPVGSPIPPPPSYPYPVFDDSKLDLGGSAVDHSAAGLEEESIRPQKQGRVEYRVDLLPDPDLEEGPPASLGYIEVRDGEQIKLEECRQRILNELDEVPNNFIFTRKGVPIGLRQEKKRTIQYIASADNAITIRIDSTVAP